MLRQLFSKLALGFSLAFTLTIGVIHLQPLDRHLGTLLTPTDCAAPCFMGITPTVTTLDEAMTILETHEWVKQIGAYSTGLNGFGSIFWSWSGKQPDYIDWRFDGRLWVQDDIIQSLVVQTNIPFGDVWALLKRPEQGSVAASIPLTIGLYYHNAVYHNGTLQARSIASCPLNMQTFWRAPTEIGLRHVSSDEYTDYDLGDWLRHPPCG